MDGEAECAHCGLAARRPGVCRRCGASTGGAELFAPDPGPSTASTSGVARRGWSRSHGLVLAAVGALLAVALVVADRSSPAEDPPATPPSTSTPMSTARASAFAPAEPTTSTSTGLRRPASSATVAGEDVWPAALAVPPGLAGTLDLGFFDGTIGTLDLSTGALRRLTRLELPQPAGLYALGDSLLVTDGGGVAVLRQVSLDDGSTTEPLPSGGRVIAAGPAGAVVQPGAGPLRFLAPGGEVTEVPLPARHEIVGLAGSRIVVQVQGRIGTMDRAGGDVVEVADGVVVAANDAVLVRLVCRIGGCELRAGPWDDLDRTRMPDHGGFTWGGALTTSGSHVVIQSYGAEGPTLTVIDLDAGVTVPLALAEGGVGEPQTTVLTADGGSLLQLTGSSIVVHPLAGGPPATIELPDRVLVGAIRA